MEPSLLTLPQLTGWWYDDDDDNDGNIPVNWNPFITEMKSLESHGNYNYIVLVNNDGVLELD